MLLKNKVSLLLMFITIFSFSVHSQEHKSLSTIEDTLASLQRRISKSTNDTIKQTLNSRFRIELIAAIDIPGSFTYPFDSLKKMSKLMAPEKKFRIYNWNLPLINGGNKYFCYLQIPDKKEKNHFSVIGLMDKSDSIPDPDHSALNARNWYGAVYYKIIPKSTEDGTIYTLLGWEGKNQLEMQKIIEIMILDENNLPHFGKKIFNKYKDGENKRVIFKYSPLASMVLRYEEQGITKGKKWNPSTQAFDEIKSKASMIVCDRIVLTPSPEGNGQLLLPAGDVYDGFIFENNRWNFIEAVDARNH